jgi:hypothetical protein
MCAGGASRAWVYRSRADWDWGLRAEGSGGPRLAAWLSGSVDQWISGGRRSHGRAVARRKQRDESTTRHKGNWRVPCSCLCAETPTRTCLIHLLGKFAARAACINNRAGADRRCGARASRPACPQCRPLLCGAASRPGSRRTRRAPRRAAAAPVPLAGVQLLTIRFQTRRTRPCFVKFRWLSGF